MSPFVEKANTRCIISSGQLASLSIINILVVFLHFTDNEITHFLQSTAQNLTAMKYFSPFILLLFVINLRKVAANVSAVGDPGMRRDGLRVGFEAWNFCNEVGKEAPLMGSPRAADCFDLARTHAFSRTQGLNNGGPCSLFVYFCFTFLSDKVLCLTLGCLMYVVLNAFIKWLIFSFFSKYSYLLHHVIFDIQLIYFLFLF